MRTCHYSDVLRGSAALAGFTLDDIGTPEFQLFRTFHDRRLQIAWEIHRWPEICPLDQRTFRALYDETGATIYAVGAEVLDPITQMYFQCLSAVRPMVVAGSGTAAANDTYAWNAGQGDYVSSLGYTLAEQTSNMNSALHWWQISDPAGNVLYQNIDPPGNAADPTAAWVGTTADGVGPNPTSVTYGGSNPPTINGVENSAFWAVCRTSYTADAYDGTAIYAVGTQVQNPLDENFYQRIASTGTADGAWTAANWGLLKVFERNIAWDQAWAANPVGEFLAAWDKDPRITTKLVKLRFQIDQDGAQFVQLRNTFNYGWAPASTNFSYVWLLYRLRRPELTGDVLDTTVVYTSGQQVYYKSTGGTGDFWTATATTAAGDTPESAPAKWSLVAIPYTFRQYLIEGGFADWLTSDGQDDKSAKREGLATAALEMEADKLQRQQQQTWRFDWRHV